MTHRTGFARTDDGHQLYWRALGSGPPIVCCNGVGVSTFFFKYIAEHFKEHHTVILWDYRGHGRSSVPDDPATADLSIERNARDLHTVLGTVAGHETPPVLLGHSMGCQVILEYAKQHPNYPVALVPMFGTFARPLDTFMDMPYARRGFNIIKRLAALGGRNGTRALLPLYANPLASLVGGLTGMTDPHYAKREDIDKYLEHLIHMNPHVFLRMVDLMADHDLSDDLPNMNTPTIFESL